MAAQPIPYYTPEEYLELEEKASVKSEYLSGQIYAMAGGTPKHSAISNNIGREIGNLLRRKPCQVYNSDLRVTVMPTGLKTYPDVTVVCGEPHLHPFDQNSIINPTVIIEVLSPSTEGYDRGEKWAHYRRLDSLQEYVLVSQDKPRLEHYVRRENGTWSFTSVDGLGAAVMVMGESLSLAEVYAKITFPAADPLREQTHAE